MAIRNGIAGMRIKMTLFVINHQIPKILKALCVPFFVFIIFAPSNHSFVEQDQLTSVDSAINLGLLAQLV